MGNFYREIEKAELHVHLEGSLWPETLAEIDPSVDAGEVRRRYGFVDFQGFIESFKWVLGYLRGPDEYALATRRLLERLQAENVTYTEITLSAGSILWRKMEFGAIYDAVVREASRSPVEVWWVLDAVRHFGVDHVMEAARLAVERTGGGVVAFGIGGDEVRGPVAWFHEVFQFVKEHGLRVVPHAGETVGAESVRAALDAGADRIGHGIRAVEDPALLQRLRRESIPLEICITSNVATGAVARLEDHPVRRIYEAGVPIVLNTDDPAMFGATITAEYELAETRFGFTRTELKELARRSFLYACRPRAEHPSDGTITHNTDC